MERLYERLTPAAGVYFDATLIERRQTEYQLLEVYDTPEFGRMFRLDGCNMTSERDEFFYHECLVHPALTAHPAPHSALIIGGGDGGSAEEILKHACIEQVHLVELDPAVVEAAKQHFDTVHQGAFDSPRLKLTIGDGMAYLHAPSRQYDLIALDLTDPIGPAEALYAAAFFADCAAALRPGGALTLHLGAPFFHAERVRWILANLKSAFACVQPYACHVPLYGAHWAFALASTSLDARAAAPESIEARLAARGVGARQLYNGEMHRALFAQPEYLKALLE